MAAGAIANEAATRGVRRHMPDPVPVMVLAGLVVDRRTQAIKLGSAQLQDAVNRAAAVSLNIDVCALIVPAWHDSAKQFYEPYGFHESPQQPLTLMLRLSTLKA